MRVNFFFFYLVATIIEKLLFFLTNKTFKAIKVNKSCLTWLICWWKNETHHNHIQMWGSVVFLTWLVSPISSPSTDSLCSWFFGFDFLNGRCLLQWVTVLYNFFSKLCETERDSSMRLWGSTDVLKETSEDTLLRLSFPMLFCICQCLCTPGSYHPHMVECLSSTQASKLLYDQDQTGLRDTLPIWHPLSNTHRDKNSYHTVYSPSIKLHFMNMLIELWISSK